MADHETLVATRRSLHAVAELLLAGPQHSAGQGIRLRPTPGGFGTTGSVDIRVDGTDLITPTSRIALEGTFGEVSLASGLRLTSLSEVYADSTGIGAEDRLVIDAASAKHIAAAFAAGLASLEQFGSENLAGPSSLGEAVPVLWPEHFDVAMTLDEVNYGVSPGDDYSAEPYAYVGPWNTPHGAFWNAPFGAARPLQHLPGPALTQFFRDGAQEASR